jgi:hypothetical protein
MANCPICGYWSKILCPCNQAKKIANEQEIFNRLLERYPSDYLFVANVCDDILDRSGCLLGEIRNNVVKPKEVEP